MPLIIESYENPFTKIKDLLFPTQEFKYISEPVSEPTEELYCYTRKEDNPESIRYYFSRIYFIENDKIVCINKITQNIKFYDINTGRLIVFDEMAEEQPKIDKTEFLPQLEVQKGEIVVFPEEEDEI